jgi:medium-chain acyl-[acyl-carrier-protein] hydrolase
MTPDAAPLQARLGNVEESGGGPDRWSIRRKRTSPASFEVYYLAHAGGTGGEFANSVFARDDVELVGLRYPGRGRRWREPSFDTMRALTWAMVDEIDFGESFGLFGHSMGALAAFEIARRLLAVGRPGPRCLWLSACPAPHLPRPEEDLHHLADAEFLQALADRHGAVPREVIEDPAMANMIVPPLRADYKLVESHRFQPGPPLPGDIHVLYGTDDTISMARLSAWADLAETAPTMHGFPGGHFYLREHGAAVLQLIERTVPR